MIEPSQKVGCVDLIQMILFAVLFFAVAKSLRRIVDLESRVAALEARP